MPSNPGLWDEIPLGFEVGARVCDPQQRCQAERSENYFASAGLRRAAAHRAALRLKRRGISLPPEIFRAGEGGGALRWPPQSKTRTGRWKKICFDGAYFRRDLAAKTFLTAKDTNLASDRNRRKSIKSCYNPSSVSFN